MVHYTFNKVLMKTLSVMKITKRYSHFDVRSSGFKPEPTTSNIKLTMTSHSYKESIDIVIVFKKYKYDDG